MDDERPGDYIQGSPPRVRGKDIESSAQRTRFGITPARAGKSPWAAPSRPRHWDHPRACGEKTHGTFDPSTKTGSPPRVRGKVVLSVVCHFVAGITPARAGKRVGLVVLAHHIGDHPRACGEKVLSSWLSSSSPGSPPRVRGKGAGANRRLTPVGITPARAGKSQIKKRHRKARRDHPRACGEKSVHFYFNGRCQGSPPRVRGKVERCQSLMSHTGITPARAGKRSLHQLTRSPIRDHPRACGEKWNCRSGAAFSLGSPPRVRGKVAGVVAAIGGPGITPARAGKRASK